MPLLHSENTGNVSASEESRKIWDGPSLTLLLAEDNPTNQHLAATILRKMGHEVTVVSDGEEALACFETGRHFDLVLMDIQMPRLDGETALQRIRALETAQGTASTPVVAVTAHAFAGDRDRFLSKGFDDYLAKPYRISTLAEVLKAILCRGVQ